MSFFGKLFNNKIFLLVLSALVAVILWFYVNGVYNPEDVKTYSDVPLSVELEGSVPEQNGLTILSLSDTTVDVRLEGSRVTLVNTPKANIVATVDLDGVTLPGEYDLPIRVTVKASGLTVQEQSLATVSVVFERTETKKVEPKIVTSGTVEPGYMLADVTTSPSAVTVTGPVSLVDRIENFLVNVDITGVTTVKTVRQEVQLIDADGRPVTSRYFKTDVDSVSVNIPIYYIKEVPLAITAVNKSGGTDASVLSYEIEPKKVRIAGPQAEIALINQIIVDTVDTSRLETGDVLTYDMPAPNGIMVLDQVEEVTVDIRIEEAVTRTFRVSSFEMANIGDGVYASVRDSFISVRVRGLSSDIEALDASQIRGIIDLSSVTAADSYATVPVTFAFPEGSKVGVVGKYTLSVNIR